MDSKVNKVKLKDGTELNHVKSKGRHLFFNKLVAISNWQLYILLFILVFSILISFFEVYFITDGFNKILEELATIKAGNMSDCIYTLNG